MLKGVNLSRRPFVNRRPLIRLAILLWVVGAALLMLNIRLFGGHWTGTADNRQRLADVTKKIRQERKLLEAQDRELRRAGVVRQNRRVKFLNSLITYRTFPWSALFEDLEEILPRDVKLLSVQPSVKLIDETPETTRQRRRSVPRRGRSGVSGTVVTESEEVEAELAEEEGDGEEEEAREDILGRNEVKLKLSTVAKSEEALMELLDALYESPSFRAPHLPGEIFTQAGGTSANITVVYLTRSTRIEEPPVIAAQDPESTGDGPEGTLMVAEDVPGDGPPDGFEDEDEVETRLDPEIATVARPRQTSTSSATAPAVNTRAESSPATQPAARSAAQRPASQGAGAGRPAAANPRVVGAGAVPQPSTSGRGTTPNTAPDGAAATTTTRPARPGAQARPGTGRPTPGSPTRPGSPSGNEDDEDATPGFTEPEASATPRVRRGSLRPPAELPWRLPVNRKAHDEVLA